MADKLSGRVAQILDARELVINLGREKGVKPGMKFAVLAEQTMEIRDPETGEVLDLIDREKTRVEAMEVRDKISICRTYRNVVYPGGILWQMRQLQKMPPGSAPPFEAAETLQMKDDPQLQTLAPEDSYVKIGDRVKEIVD